MLLKNNANQPKVKATTGHVLIEHTVRDEWYFANLKQAQDKLLEISKNFITENNALFNAPKEDVVLWIKNYATNAEDRTRGFVGHFARIFITRGDDGFLTLKASKLDIPLSKHPQRNKRSRFPSWSNPVLKAILAGKIYATKEDAQKALQALHEGYPDASTPGNLKLSLTIASRSPENPQETLKQHYIFTAHPIDGHDEKGYIIIYKDITRTTKTVVEEAVKAPEILQESSAAPTVAEPEPLTKPKGYFASLVAMKKSSNPRS